MHRKPTQHRLTVIVTLIGMLCLCTTILLPQARPKLPVEPQGELLSQVGSRPALKAGGAHSFRLPLHANQYIELRVQQLAIDVQVRLLRSNGEQACEMDGPGGDRGLEVLRFITQADDTYTVEIRSTVDYQPDGRYEISKVVMRSPSADDPLRVATHQAYREGIELYFARNTESTRKSIPIFESVLANWEKTGDSDLSALALHLWGQRMPSSTTPGRQRNIFPLH